ncbi:MAG: AAA family ATPase [Chitinivibrionales bacterium]|nr:AAA family ATPase [Chitinivibrionales bacterium]
MTVPGRKPLLLHDARLVGKTYAVRFFAREFPTFVEAHLERPENTELFKGTLKPADILQALMLNNPPRVREGATLLFFDEIQACPPVFAQRMSAFGSKITATDATFVERCTRLLLSKWPKSLRFDTIAKSATPARITARGMPFGSKTRKARLDTEMSILG